MEYRKALGKLRHSIMFYLATRNKTKGQTFSDSTPKVDFVLRRADVNHFRCRLSKHTCQSNLFRNRLAVSCTPNRVYTALDAENSELYYTVEFEQMSVLQTRPMKCDPPLRRDSKSILVAGSSPGAGYVRQLQPCIADTNSNLR